MKRKTFFSVLGALLILQSAAAQKAVLDTVYLQLNLDSVGLDEVVVKGRRTPVANSRWSDMTPVDLVTVEAPTVTCTKRCRYCRARRCRAKPGNCW